MLGLVPRFEVMLLPLKMHEVKFVNKLEALQEFQSSINCGAVNPAVSFLSAP